jgi:hypothetical protein
MSNCNKYFAFEIGIETFHQFFKKVWRRIKGSIIIWSYDFIKNTFYYYIKKG